MSHSKALRIVLATHNAGKVRELADPLTEFGVEVLGLSSFPEIGEIEETGTTFEENALIKARAVAALTGLVSVADDSGLEVDALSKAPGVYSARYSDDWQSQPGESRDARNIRKLLHETANVPADKRGCRFVSCMTDILTAIKNKGLTGSLVSADGTTTIDLQTGTLPTTGNYYLKLNNIDTFSGPNIDGQVTSSSNWNIRSAANAKYTVDNWPVEMESATNSVSDVLTGVVFTIQDKGSATLSVSTDITSVEKSIQSFLDSVNSILMTINESSKYDPDKAVTTNDPKKTTSDNYSTSQLTTEKGGLLQGNYGVQLFKSRFTSMRWGASSTAFATPSKISTF